MTRASENNLYYICISIAIHNIPKMYILKSVYFITYTLVFPSYAVNIIIGIKYYIELVFEKITSTSAYFIGGKINVEQRDKTKRTHLKTCFRGYLLYICV